MRAHEYQLDQSLCNRSYYFNYRYGSTDHLRTFLKKMFKSGLGFFQFLQQGMNEKTGLDIYLNALEAHTLRITHPWMKEE